MYSGLTVATCLRARYPGFCDVLTLPRRPAHALVSGPRKLTFAMCCESIVPVLQTRSGDKPKPQGWNNAGYEA